MLGLKGSHYAPGDQATKWGRGIFLWGLLTPSDTMFERKKVDLQIHYICISVYFTSTYHSLSFSLHFTKGYSSIKVKNNLMEPKGSKRSFTYDAKLKIKKFVPLTSLSEKTVDFDKKYKINQNVSKNSPSSRPG